MKEIEIKTLLKEAKNNPSLFVKKLLSRGGPFVIDLLLTHGVVQGLKGFVQDWRQEKVLEQLKLSDEELKESLKDKISKNYLASEEFLHYFIALLNEATKVENVDKTKYFRSALLNGGIRQDIEKDKKLFYVNCLSNLRTESLSVLAIISDIYKKTNNKRTTFDGIIKEGCLDYNNADYIMANTKALERFNLITIDIPMAKTSCYSNYAIEYTRLGQEFVDFVMGYD